MRKAGGFFFCAVIFVNSIHMNLFEIRVSRRWTTIKATKMHLSCNNRNHVEYYNWLGSITPVAGFALCIGDKSNVNNMHNFHRVIHATKGWFESKFSIQLSRLTMWVLFLNDEFVGRTREPLSSAPCERGFFCRQANELNKPVTVIWYFAREESRSKNSMSYSKFFLYFGHFFFLHRFNSREKHAWTSNENRIFWKR